MRSFTPIIIAICLPLATFAATAAFPSDPSRQAPAVASPATIAQPDAAPAAPPAADSSASSASQGEAPVAAPPSQELLPLAPTPAAAWSTPVPFNFARSVTGAGIVVTPPGGSPRTLTYANSQESPFSPMLGVDSTVGAPLPAGKTNVVVDLGPLCVNVPIVFAGFFSRTAAGSIELFYAPNVSRPLSPRDSRWRSANATARFGQNQYVTLPFAPVLSRYILLAFDITAPGDVNTLAVFGPPSTDLTNVPTPKQPGVDGQPPTANPNAKMTEFDFAPAIYGSRVAYVAGTDSPNVQSVLDGNPQSGVELGEGDMADNLMIVDLGSTKEVNKFGMLFKPSGPGKFEIYMLNTLPEGLEPINPADAPAAPTTTTGTQPAAPAPSASAPAVQPTAMLWRQADGRLAPLLLAAAPGSLAESLVLMHLGALAAGVQQATLPASFFTDNRPNSVQDIAVDQDRVSLKFEKLPCRFLLLRWVPADPNNSGINLFEINLIGDVPEEELPNLIAELAPFFNTPPSTPAPEPGSTPTPTPPPDEGLTPDPPPIPPPVSP